MYIKKKERLIQHRLDCQSQLPVRIKKRLETVNLKAKQEQNTKYRNICEECAKILLHLK